MRGFFRRLWRRIFGESVVDVDPKSLNLGQPAESQFAAKAIEVLHAKVEREQAEFKAKYGDDWREKWIAHICPSRDYDVWLKDFNTAIYQIGTFHVRGIGDFRRIEAEFDQRCHEVYGDEYDSLIGWHEYADSRVVELLLQDALRTGRWKELPDELQDEYHRRVNGGVV